MRRNSAPDAKSDAARPRGGFSLIELLIVVAIILIIAAIAIPNFIRSRIAANEAAAVASCRNVTTAEVVYSSTYGIGYSATLATLSPPPGGGPVSSANAGLVDEVLGSGLKSGYRLTYVPAPPNALGRIDAFQLYADPVNPNVTGIRHFYTDDSGVIRQNLSAKASVTDPPV